MKQIVTSVLVLIPLLLQGFDKSVYDLDYSTLSKSKALDNHHLSSSNAVTEFTLIEDGYFTLGTNAGLSESPLDDHCQLTFGHPYAMTSYFYFSLNGQYYHPELYFYDHSKTLSQIGDTLRLILSDDALVSIQFDMYPVESTKSGVVRLEWTVTNIGASVLTSAFGLMLDPAIGKYGDAAIFTSSGKSISESEDIEAVNGPIMCQERATQPSGIGFELNWSGDSPDQASIGNWPYINNSDNGQFPDEDLLYDAAVKLLWFDQALASGRNYTNYIDLALTDPIFPEGPFMRADFPQALSIEAGSLYPDMATPFVEILNNNTSSLSDLSIALNADRYIESWINSGNFNLTGNGISYTNVSVYFPELYDNVVVPVTLSLQNSSGGVLDELVKNVFIPAIPYSDTGLVVSVDSVALDHFPDVSLFFNAKYSDTDQPILNLQYNNIFLYDDDLRNELFTIIKDTTNGSDMLDLVFILDVTGSMGNEITGVKENIVEFSDSLERKGVDYRLGMVTFLDVIEHTYSFTSNVTTFQQYVNEQYAHGGGDLPENSLAALYAGTEMDFRPDAQRMFIWITDASYHINNVNTSLTIQDVVNAALANGITIHCIGAEAYRVDYYDPIVNPTNGDYYDINGNFRDILLSISDMNAATTEYILGYTAVSSELAEHKALVEVHYAGLGGVDSLFFTPEAKSLQSAGTSNAISCYPNPFNPVIHIKVMNPEMLGGTVRIYNILGQTVRKMSFPAGNSVSHIIWNAMNDFGKPVGNGVYFLMVDFNGDGTHNLQPLYQKIIYTK